ncbi:hypothetical protein EVA_12680 [gut metagenome]|uniref:Uncharacterized protein n=1 Tax=gut metagenome TaxID=749906 RepID=J9GI90_9ZZZZ
MFVLVGMQEQIITYATANKTLLDSREGIDCPIDV